MAIGGRLSAQYKHNTCQTSQQTQIISHFPYQHQHKIEAQFGKSSSRFFQEHLQKISVLKSTGSFRMWEFFGVFCLSKKHKRLKKHLRHWAGRRKTFTTCFSLSPSFPPIVKFMQQGWYCTMKQPECGLRLLTCNVLREKPCANRALIEV